MNNFNEFIDYCLSFYGVGGIYPENKRTKEQIAYATTMYLDACAYYENEKDKPWTKDFKVRSGAVVTLSTGKEYATS